MKRLFLCAVLLLTFTSLVCAQTTDPCSNYPKATVVINQTAAGPTTLVAGQTGRNIYVCSAVIGTASQSVNLIAGTGTNCGTAVHAGLFGGSTAATGITFGATDKIVIGTGAATVAKTTTAADNLCIIVSGAAQVSGNLTYVIR